MLEGLTAFEAVPGWPGQLAECIHLLPEKSKALLLEYCVTENIIDRALYAVRTSAYYASLTESPIETIFATAFTITVCKEKFKERELFILYPQYDMEIDGKKYVADFLSSFNSLRGENLIIECDGHEEHHSTKAKVAYDNKRTIDMKLKGYDVIRFSGTQLFCDPMWCAEKAMRIICKKVRTHYHEQY